MQIYRQCELKWSLKAQELCHYSEGAARAACRVVTEIRPLLVPGAPWAICLDQMCSWIN